MTALPITTKRRLNKIPQTNAVWEGDRRAFGSIITLLEAESDANDECIMWVDGSEGSVRAMEMVSADLGLEAIVRTLLRAIESPHHPAVPARPQKVVIRDRRLQFFLRGALEGLDIEIEYASDLPLIDELFRGFETVSKKKFPNLPQIYTKLLTSQAQKIWKSAPWEILTDSDILTLEISNYKIDTLYACIIGIMSAEYGVLVYRSLESLKQFRAAALQEQSPEFLEQAFLAQDCWFLNYDTPEEEPVWLSDRDYEVIPLFGSLHPFEGMRTNLDEEEAKIVYLVLEAINRFCTSHRNQLAQDQIAELKAAYELELPKKCKIAKKFLVAIATAPQLTEELIEMENNQDSSDAQNLDLEVPIHDDLVPPGSLIKMGEVPRQLVENLKLQAKTYCQDIEIKPKSQKDLPAIFIQTSRPKAKKIIDTIIGAGGLKSICFNPGSDPFSEEDYELGLLQTKNKDLYIFAEYSYDAQKQKKIIQKWHQNCQKSHGYCSLVIAMGVTGVNRGNPKLKDMLAIFETKTISVDELGIGVLQLMPDLD